MLKGFIRFLRSIGWLKSEKPPVVASLTDSNQSLVVVVSNELIDLFNQVTRCTQTGDAQGRKAALTEILLRFGDDIEITAVPSDRTAIRVRPRQARFSALIVAKLGELDQEVCRMALARMLQRPVQNAAATRAKPANLPQARLVP